VERQWIGGACHTVACLPSKNEIWSTRIAHVVRNAAQFGLTTGAVTVDMAKVRQRKRARLIASRWPIGTATRRAARNVSAGGRQWPKDVVLNKTNALHLQAAYGDDTDGWSGQRIEIWRDGPRRPRGSMPPGAICGTR
jgi:hypothetical protein